MMYLYAACPFSAPRNSKENLPTAVTIIISLDAKAGYEKTLSIFEELSKYSENMGVLCDICSVTTQKYDNNQSIGK